MIALPLLAAATGDDRAGRTEPFWSLTVRDARTLLRQVGAPTVATRVRRRRGAARYVARDIAVVARRRDCSDGMSDRRLRDTVSVSWRGRRLRGCGGGPR